MKEEKKIRERVDYRDVREMVEDIGDRFGTHGAYAYRINPRDKEIQKKNYIELRSDVRSLATAFISRGLAGKHITLIGKFSYNWVLVYYASLVTGSVLIPLDREWNATDLADTAKRANTGVVIFDDDIADKAKEVSDATGAEASLSVDSDINELLREGARLFSEGDRSYY